ncbi:MAG: Hpt domain-containing protein [Oscillospiraceae bacterium]|nr:Hpt domain-containing protein [Oscillospiraceae bacterium]
MNLKEYYERIEGDYSGVVSRLMNEKLVMKFVIKFLDDTSFDLLCKSLEEGNNEEAFRAAHTLKGIAQNLSFDKFYKSVYEITEELRNGGSANEATFERVKADYLYLFETTEQLRADNE